MIGYPHPCVTDPTVSLRPGYTTGPCRSRGDQIETLSRRHWIRRYHSRRYIALVVMSQTSRRRSSRTNRRTRSSGLWPPSPCTRKTWRRRRTTRARRSPTCWSTTTARNWTWGSPTCPSTSRSSYNSSRWVGVTRPFAVVYTARNVNTRRPALWR